MGRTARSGGCLSFGMGQDCIRKMSVLDAGQEGVHGRRSEGTLELIAGDHGGMA